MKSCEILAIRILNTIDVSATITNDDDTLTRLPMQPYLPANWTKDTAINDYIEMFNLQDVDYTVISTVAEI